MNKVIVLKSNLSDKVAYRVLTAVCCNKITFSDDDRRFTSHEMRNSSWTAEFTNGM